MINYYLADINLGLSFLEREKYLERGLKEEVEMKMSSDEVMVEEVAEVEGGGGGDEVGRCGTHPGYWSEESERLMSLRH